MFGSLSLANRLSVLIKQNQQVIAIRPRIVAKCSWEDTFEMLKMQAEITVEKGKVEIK